MKHRYTIVTNGSEFAYWDRRIGNWNTKSTFEPICLLDDDDARDVLRTFNEGRCEDEPQWTTRAAWLEIEGVA